MKKIFLLVATAIITFISSTALAQCTTPFPFSGTLPAAGSPYVYSNTSFHLTSSITVSNNTVLEFHNVELCIDQGVEIRVDNNGILKVDNDSYFHSANPGVSMWNGIIVVGGGSSSLCTFEESILEDAVNGIRSNTNGEMFVRDAIFRNNEVHLKFVGGIGPNPSRITGSTFTCNSTIPSTSNAYSEAGVVLEGSGEVIIGNPNATSFSAYSTRNHFKMMNEGVSAEEVQSLFVFNNYFEPSPAAPNRRGVYAKPNPFSFATAPLSVTIGGASANPGASPLGNTFMRCQRGVLIDRIEDVSVEGNQFLSNNVGVRCMKINELIVNDNVLDDITNMGVWCDNPAGPSAYPTQSYEINNNELSDVVNTAIFVNNNNVNVPSSMYDCEVNNNFIDQARNGINIRKFDGVEASNNEIILRPIYATATTFGVQLKECNTNTNGTQNLLSNNRVSQSGNHYTGQHVYGLYVNNSPETIVEENTLFNLYYCLHFWGNNTDVEIWCNRFQNCYTGVYFFNANSGITLDIGGWSTPSGNTWTLNTMKVEVGGSPFQNTGSLLNWFWAGPIVSEYNPNENNQSNNGNGSFNPLNISPTWNVPFAPPCTPQAVPRLGESSYVVNIYPNPAKDLLHIESPVEDVSLRLFNLMGQVVLEEALIQGVQNINLDNLAPGVYHCQLEGKQGFYHQEKIIVQ
jgi:hypothetical protein